MTPTDPPRKRLTFVIEGDAHSREDLASLLHDLAFDIEREAMVSRVSSRGYSFKVEDHGGPTPDEYEDQLTTWVGDRR